jgi:hypothetical protein
MNLDRALIQNQDYRSIIAAHDIATGPADHRIVTGAIFTDNDWRSVGTGAIDFKLPIERVVGFE